MDYLDMLANLGVGNAHPGGFSATLEQLKKFPISPNAHVLEVGCGTGRTACYLASQGYKVTGLDIRPRMIEKAIVRAKKSNLDVEFIEGDVRGMPFSNDRFDVVLAESVTIFAEPERATKEYWRVLRPGGVLYDREIVAEKGFTPEVVEAVQKLYGLERLMSAAEWLDILKQNGFSAYEIGEHDEFSLHMLNNEMDHPDHLQITDNGIFMNSALWKTADYYTQIMSKYREYFGYALFIAQK